MTVSILNISTFLPCWSYSITLFYTFIAIWDDGINKAMISIACTTSAYLHIYVSVYTRSQLQYLTGRAVRL